jgi:hypothetical protein
LLRPPVLINVCIIIKIKQEDDRYTKRRGNIRRMVWKGALRKVEDERKKIIMYREEKQEEYFPLGSFSIQLLPPSPPPHQKKPAFLLPCNSIFPYVNSLFLPSWSLSAFAA